MDKRIYHGWRMYRCRVMCDGEIGVNHLRRPKWFPANSPINSTWITREEAARTLRLERNFEPQEANMNDVMIPAPTDLAGHIETLESEDETRAKLRKALVALGVTKAELCYNGSGDEGNIEEATLSTEQKAELSIPYDLHIRLTDWAWDFVCGYHSGFQDNDGGFGTLTWDMATGAITLDHNDNVIDSVQTLREGV